MCLSSHMHTPSSNLTDPTRPPSPFSSSPSPCAHHPLQLAQEDAYRELAALHAKPCILLHDRGALDGSSFCDDDEWAQVLQLVGTTESRLCERYELVLHLASPASEQRYEQFYQFGEVRDRAPRPVRHAPCVPTHPV